jgi:Flp pilus assembly protein TadD
MDRNLEKAKEDFILMAEAGFIAINQADEDAALKLFRAAQLLKPDNSLPKIGMGYLHFLKLELKQASKLFQEVIALEPHNDMAKAFLGLSTALTPNEATKGEKILEEAKHSKDPNIKKMAASAIDFVEKFVKKAPAASPGPASASHKSPKKKK